MSTAMLTEALQAPQMVAQQLAQDQEKYAAFGALLRADWDSAGVIVKASGAKID